MKKILFICPMNPARSNTGGGQRSKLLYKALSEIAEVDILCPADHHDGHDLPNTIYFGEDRLVEPDIVNEKKVARLVRTTKIFFSKEVLGANKDRRWAAKTHEVLKNKKYDYLVIRHIDTAIFCDIPLSKKVIIDIDDLPEQRFLTKVGQHHINPLKKLLRSNFQFQIKFHTKKIAKSVKTVFLPNKSQCPQFSNSLHLPNIPFRLRDIQDAPNGGMQVLFVGTLNYGPNVNGLNRFLDHSWPKVLNELPDARLNIVGSQNTEENKKKWAAVAGVNVIGYVDDIIAQYEQNNIALAPVYVGAGTNIKVLEAMGLSRPIVVTPFACKGFEELIEDGTNIVVAQNDDDFASKIIELLKDDSKAKAIGRNAKQSITDKYSYPSFRDIVHQSLQ